ncbi:extracellular solute-binding protein [Egibacter rhizosphaerae]|uniref:Extracellular solute-binding protein n=1 Tax=Egibacter rhizosphaerae TaxID=1670831 RepID=A0A411YDB9_9ACTN|nr:extracellular solute-binding protein [Egibacter rhizosphaerae]QBI19214.1 extracellular solute-binding protein [Egibacter rhizosphaerae]
MRPGLTPHPLRALLALLALTVLLAACEAEEAAEGEPDEPDEEEPDEAEPDADEPDAEDEAEPDEAEPDEDDEADGASGDHDGESITVWIMQPGSDDLEEMLEGFTADFEEETGADVDLLFQPWPDAHDAFTTAIAGDDMPDVAEMGTTWTPEFGELGVFAEQEDSGDVEYIEALVESGTPEGTPLGAPWYAGARALIYNAEVFDELGLEPPEDWDELVDVGETIQAETDMHAYGVVGAGANHFVLPRVWQAGGEIGEQHDDGTWEATLNEQEGVEAFDEYASLWSEHEFAPDGALNWDVNDAQDAFINEDMAMFEGLGPNLGVVQGEAEDLEVGVAPLPEGPAGNRDTLAGGSHLVRFADSQSPETAQAYIEYLLADERVAEFSEAVGFFPGTIEGIEAMDLDEHGEVFAEMLTDHSRSYPPTAEWGGFEGEALFTDAVQLIMQGDVSAQEALDDVADDMNDAFQE